MKHERQIWKKEDGLAAVEFALLAPVMILMITGFLELGYVTFARSTLESATLEAARSASATECPANRDEEMRMMIARRMEVITSADGSGPNIVVKAYGGNFSDVHAPEPFTDEETKDRPKNKKWDTGESYTDLNGNGKWDDDIGVDGSLGAAGDVVSYTTSYNVASLVPFLSERLNNGRNYYPITASTVIRNEPVFRDRCPAES